MKKKIDEIISTIMQNVLNNNRDESRLKNSTICILRDVEIVCWGFQMKTNLFCDG